MANDGGLKRYYLSEDGYICDGRRPEGSRVLDASELVDLANKSAALESQLAEARAEIERLWRAGANTARELDEARAKYAEISEEHTKRVEEIADLRVRVAELERKRREIESARNEIGGMEGDEHIHCGQMIAKEMGLRFGVQRDRDAWRSDSMLHRRQRDDTRARADRLAEAADDLFPTARADEWGEMREALAAYRSDSPPQGEAVHPDTERLQFLIDQEATITLDRRVPTFVVDWVKAGGSIEEARSSDPREAIDAARESEGEE